MNSTQISILKQPNQISLSGLLKSGHSAALEPQISLEILSDFPHQPLERQLPNKKLSALLVLPDFSECDCSGTEPVRLLHSSSRRCRFPSCLCCQLLSWGLASGGLASSLLRAGHWIGKKQTDYLILEKVERKLIDLLWG